MKNNFLYLVPLFLSFFAIIPIAAQDQLTFTIKNAGIQVEGYFAEFEKDVNLNDKNLKASHFNGVVIIASINTGIPMRDRHLLKKDYFNAEKFPKMSFTSKEIKLMSDGSFRAIGDITIKGKTKPIEFKIEVQKKSEKKIYQATAQLNRRDFGVGGWNIAMADEVNISIILEQ